VVSDAELGGFLVCTLVPVFELGSCRIFVVVGGWFSLQFGHVGVSNLLPSPNGEGGASQTGPEPQKGGVNMALLKEEGKQERTKYI
jgi:hypothetical protein